MRHLAKSLIRLYPAHWRKRYGDEFEALLEDSSPGIRGVFDLMKGAIKMRLTFPSFPKLALLLSIAGVLAGLGVSFLVKPLYVSRATLLFESTPGFLQSSLRADMGQFVPQVLSRISLSSVIEDVKLYPEERAKKPLEQVIEQMRTRDIKISSVAMGSVALTISFSYRDREKARDAVQAIVAKFIQANLTRRVAAPRTDEFAQLESRLSAVEKRLGISSPAPSGQLVAFTGTQVELLDPASLPAKPVSPDRRRFMLYGLVTGFAVALVIAIFRPRVPPALPSPATTA